MVETIIFSNTRGFQNKKNNIEHFVDNKQPVVFSVAEHFQSSTTHLQLPNYELAACYCRPKKGTKGGVAIFVRLGLKFIPRTDLDAFNLERVFEVRSIEIEQQNMVVTVIYRSPSKSLPHFLDILENILITFRKEPDKRHVIGGDFNVRNEKSKKLETVFAKYDYFLTTNVKTHNYGNCLDNIAVNFTPSFTKVMKEQLSDHNCIKLVFLQESEKKKSSTLKTNTIKAQESKENSSSGEGDSNNSGSQSSATEQICSRLHATSESSSNALDFSVSKEESSFTPETDKIKKLNPKVSGRFRIGFWEGLAFLGLVSYWGMWGVWNIFEK